jgi:hypothetical protein
MPQKKRSKSDANRAIKLMRVMFDAADTVEHSQEDLFEALAIGAVITLQDGLKLSNTEALNFCAFYLLSKEKAEQSPTPTTLKLKSMLAALRTTNQIMGKYQ